LSSLNKSLSDPCKSQHEQLRRVLVFHEMAKKGESWGLPSVSDLKEPFAWEDCHTSSKVFALARSKSFFLFMIKYSVTGGMAAGGRDSEGIRSRHKEARSAIRNERCIQTKEYEVYLVGGRGLNTRLEGRGCF